MQRFWHGKVLQTQLRCGIEIKDRVLDFLHSFIRIYIFCESLWSLFLCFYYCKVIRSITLCWLPNFSHFPQTIVFHHYHSSHYARVLTSGLCAGCYSKINYLPQIATEPTGVSLFLCLLWSRCQWVVLGGTGA